LTHSVEFSSVLFDALVAGFGSSNNHPLVYSLNALLDRVAESTMSGAAAGTAGSGSRAHATILDCQIVDHRIIDDVVHYIIKVSTANETWFTIKRYSRFEDFHALLLDCVNDHSLPAGAELPGKRFKLWYSHTSPQFIEERSVLLENYLKKLCTVPQVASSTIFVGFLATDRIQIDESKLDTRTLLQKIKDLNLPEEVEVTCITIPQIRMMSDHVLYKVDVMNEHKDPAFNTWTVLKRFAQFVELDEALRASFAHLPEVLNALPSPPERHSKVIQDHMDDHFVEHRRVLLEHYMQKLMLVTPVLYEPNFLNFLGVQV